MKEVFWPNTADYRSNDPWGDHTDTCALRITPFFMKARFQRAQYQRVASLKVLKADIEESCKQMRK